MSSHTREFRFCPRCAAELHEREEGGLIRLACPTAGCRFVHYENPTPVVAAILEVEGHVVLVRPKEWPERVFGLPTGFLEAREDPEAGVLREVKEELGLEAQIEDLVGLFSFPAQNQLIIAYHLNAQGAVVLGAELEAYKMIPIERLRPWPMGTGLAVEKWLSTRR